MLAELARAALVISPKAENNDNNLVFIIIYLDCIVLVKCSPTLPKE
jgi:hypothetical protein